MWFLKMFFDIIFIQLVDKGVPQGSVLGYLHYM